mgnify:FL=1
MNFFYFFSATSPNRSFPFLFRPLRYRCNRLCIFFLCTVTQTIYIFWRKSPHRKTCAKNYNLRIHSSRCIKLCLIFEHPDLMRQVLHSKFCASVYDCATYRWLDAHLCRSATHIHHVPTHSNNALQCLLLPHDESLFPNA